VVATFVTWGYNINMKESVVYWLELADYDFETARAMLDTGRYLYVGFMCHQVIEKALKAVIAKDLPRGEIPPKMHDLDKLALIARVSTEFSKEQQDFIDALNPLNIESRYPEYKRQLAAVLTKPKCEDILTETKELLCWIKKKLDA